MPQRGTEKMSHRAVKAKNRSDLMIYTRSGGLELEQPFEKPVVVPVSESKDPATHAWADARFAMPVRHLSSTNSKVL